MIGDLNARISEELVLDSELLIDLPIYKTLNTEDKKVLALIVDTGDIVLNGRTMGDSYGEFRFLGVIDYCINSQYFFLLC